MTSQPKNEFSTAFTQRNKLHFAKYLFLYPFLSGFYGYFNTFPSLSGSFFVSFYSVSPFTLPRYTFSSLPAFTFTIDHDYLETPEGQQRTAERSAQAEGAFADIKKNFGYNLLHRRGESGVKVEL